MGRWPPVLAHRALRICWFRAYVDRVLGGRAQSESTLPPARWGMEKAVKWRATDARSLRLLGYLP